MSAGPTQPSPTRVETTRPTLRAVVFGARPRGALIIAAAAISGTCLWLAVRQVDLHEFWATLEEVHWVWLLPTLALIYVTLALRALRWQHLFIEPHRVPLWESAKAANVGLLFNNILPVRAGEIPRVFALAGSTGVSKVEIGGTIVIERMLDLFTIALAALIVWPWLPDASWITALCLVCAAIVGGSLLLGAFVWALRARAKPLAEAALRRVPFISDARAAAVTTSLERGAHVLASPRRLLLALALSALVWSAAALSVIMLFPAFDLSASMASAWLIVIATSLALTVPSTSGGLGVYEAAVQASLVAAGATASGALAFALVLHAVNFVPVSITGALAAWGAVARPGGPHRTPAPARAR
jgi:glycosyltransferase 2 family protein